MTLTMIGRITDCILLAYRTPVDSVRELLPPPLEPLTYNGWAFWNIVACRVENMRPRGSPAFLGSTYHHVAYRLYARVNTRGESPAALCSAMRSQAAGPCDPPTSELDGLFFVRSDADSRLVCRMGNVFTPFRFHYSAIDLQGGPDGRCLLRVNGSMPARFTAEFAERTLLPGSCFDSYEQAARLLKYRPLALSINRRADRVNLAEVFRDESNWRETPLRVTDAYWSFFSQMNQQDATLELATRVAPIDYRWRLGRSRALKVHDLCAS